MNERDYKNCNVEISIFEYCLVFMFVVLCGFTAQSLIPLKTYILSFFSILYFFKRDVKFFLPVLIYVSAFILVGCVHYCYYHYFSENLFLKYPLVILSGAYIVKRLGKKFRYAYFNIMFLLCCISLFFFLLMVVLKVIPSMFDVPGYRSIFIYNIRNDEIENIRNCGPFWEPGAFAGYIVIAFSLFFDSLLSLLNRQKIKCFVMFLALLSTRSTQGFLAIFLLFSFYFFYKKFSVFTVIFMSLFFYIFYVTFTSFPFLGEKIQEQVEQVSGGDWDSDTNLKSAQRFSTTQLDFYNIAKHPVIGNTDDLYICNSDFPVILDLISENGEYGSGTGITGYISTYGIPFFLLWFLMSYRNIKYQTNIKSAFFFMLLLLILGNGEYFSTKILYLSIPFLEYKKITNYDSKK